MPLYVRNIIKVKVVFKGEQLYFFFGQSFFCRSQFLKEQFAWLGEILFFKSRLCVKELFHQMKQTNIHTS